MASIVEIAYALSLASVEQQEKRVNELRSRGGTLMAAAAIAASVLGSQASGAEALDVLGTLAVIAFVLAVFCVGFVIWPHRLVLEFRGSVLVDVMEETNATPEEALLAVIGWVEDFHQQNRRVLARMSNVYAVACASVGVEIILWTLSVTGTLG
jgi:hypothetical protein